MTDPATLENLLACPRCDKTPLIGSDEGWRCDGCRVDFPVIDDLPWMFAEPAAALGEWRGRLHFSLRRIDQQRQRLDAALDQPALREPTRRRLTALRDATADHAERLSALLRPLDIDSFGAAPETYLALRTRLPPDQGLTTYYPNLHRDWAWGDEENSASLDIVADALAGRPPGSVLVLGAGAGRLAYDVHRRLEPASTVALDFNPLLLAVGRRAARGGKVELYEFPIAPRSADEQAVLRTLAADEPADERLRFVLGDVHRPPFAKGSFDTIVTPWLVDILPEPLDALARRINHLLGAGGTWVNFGSLSFHGGDPALHYTIEECRAVLTDHGFAEPAVGEREMPYMCSPASRHGRRELVVTWRSDKTGKAKAPERYRALPDWIVRGNEPIPVSKEFQAQAMATRIHAFIMSLLDGRRSLKDVAKVLVEQQLMTPQEAEPAVRTFLIRMYDDSRRQTTY
ncbi:MAG: class I SAM-dependent methyltransferase [Gammaproteobacteria bacterium]|nr:class I SAM-dependent methyltransferase [Gammaproteobacteria bacterium]